MVDQLQRLLPRTVANRDDRIAQTAQALHEARVTAAELPGLVTTSRVRDAFRHWHIVLRSTLSFFPAAGAGLGVAMNPVYDTSDYPKAQADDVGERNIYIGYVLALLAISLGGQFAGRIVEGRKLGPKYMAAAPVRTDSKSAVPYAETTRGKLAKAGEFWPFAIGHATVGSGALHLGPRWTAGAFLGSTFVSSVATAASAALIDDAAPPGGLDPRWLDATTPEARDDMQAAINHLREPSLIALGGYAKDVGRSFKEAVGFPGSWARKGVMLRFIAAVVATLPRLMYASTKDPDDKAMFGVLAGLWIGLTWGALGMALFIPAKQPPAAPATRAAVDGVVPPPPDVELAAPVAVAHPNPDAVD